jgi:hypothetical protein
MISEWWWIGKDLVGHGSCLILRYCPSIRLDGLRKSTNTINLPTRSPGPRFELGTSRIPSRSINPPPQRSIRLLDNTTVAGLGVTFPAFRLTRRFISVFTRARHVRNSFQCSLTCCVLRWEVVSPRSTDHPLSVVRIFLVYSQLLSVCQDLVHLQRGTQTVHNPTLQLRCCFKR